MQEPTGVRISLFGAPGAGLNLGVGALRESAVVGLLQRRPDAAVTVFDDDWGTRSAEIRVDGVMRRYQLRGVRNSRRFYRPESYLHMRLATRLGLPNPGLKIVDDSSAVWDVSGGDSFADLYGRRRFETVTLPKELALARKRPLVLLPQTYGPFEDRTLHARARSIVARAHAAWARDVDSHAALQELLRDDFDAGRHKLGVDMAFGLQPQEPDAHVTDSIRGALARADGRPLAGLNVSGLLLGDEAAGSRYGLTVDYAQMISRLAEELLRRGAFIVLVPHVLGPGRIDSDEYVTNRLAERLRANYGDRVLVAPRSLGAGGRKWLISQLDWFSGARMHSTIAGLSSGVATAALAYSAKVRGVFDSCGQAAHVADARSATTDEALTIHLDAFDRREEIGADLRSRLPAVLAMASSQMDQIIAQSEETIDGGHR